MFILNYALSILNLKTEFFMKHNIIQEKSYAFAVKIVNLYRTLRIDSKEYVLSKQLLRSGTSIGANIEEAIGAHTKKDFISKVSIAFKEARESKYWLRLLSDFNILKKEIAIIL
jgi:four helix bundle protein